MAKPRGGFSWAQTVQPETVRAAGAGCSALWGLVVLPRVGAGGGETLRCLGLFPHWGGVGGESEGWEGAGGLLESAHLPSLAGSMRARGEGGVSPFLGSVWAQSRHGVLVRDSPIGPVHA